MPLSVALQHLIAGTIGGLATTVTLYPLELVKTRMQVIDQNVVYRSMTQSVRTILRTEGAAGLYRGLVPAMVAASGSWGGYFYFYESSKRRKSQGSVALGTVDHLLSGVEAGAIMVMVFNPMWVVKTRLALQGAEGGSSQAYRGMGDALHTIVREEGLPGLYKGLVPALLLTSHGAIQFAIYESMKATAAKVYNHDSQPAWMSVCIGGLSKIVASTATYPYQVVKSRLQQRGEGRYTGVVDCVVKMWRQHGVQGFFRGVLPNALKVAPGSALTFVIYEETLKVLKASNPHASPAAVTVSDE